MSRSRIPKALRAKVAAQARYRCGYCLAAESIVGMSMELDHLIPEALGGLTEEDNLWLACSLCNDSKGCRIAAEDPTTGVVVRLFNPRHQDWHEHFSWSEGGSMITGGTPVGRATVVALHLNRPTLVLARRASDLLICNKAACVA
jgi:hypothetical protein